MQYAVRIQIHDFLFFVFLYQHGLKNFCIYDSLIFHKNPPDDQVKDAISAVINVDDYGASARLLAATTLRNVLGTKNLGDILSDREAIANDMQVDIIRPLCIISQTTLRQPWTRPRTPGASPWRGSRSRTSESRSLCREPWRRRPRLRGQWDETGCYNPFYIL